MSTPTRPIDAGRSADVREYIGAVRAWLSDLPAEDVDDLTLGMEADLGERAAEGDVRLGELLGEPEQYAAELRAAAGLPPRQTAVASASPGWAAFFISSAVDTGADIIERHPWLRDLRPLWWVGRALAVGWLVVAVSATGLASWVLGVLLVVPSFWWGRRCRDGQVVGGALDATRGLNIVAILLATWGLLVALTSAANHPTVETWAPPGLSQNGAQVQNLYVYDAQGNRVEGARVLDQAGQRLFVDTTMWLSEDVPLRSDGSMDIANDVFPLVIGDRDPWADPQTGWTPPLTLPPLPVVPTPSPSATATPAR